MNCHATVREGSCQPHHSISQLFPTALSHRHTGCDVLISFRNGWPPNRHGLEDSAESNSMHGCYGPLLDDLVLIISRALNQ